jgi:hypothetical protein
MHLSSTFRRIASFCGATILAGALAGLAGCSGKTPTVIAAPPPPPVVNVDADPVALLPFGSVAVGTFDTHAIANSTLGGDLVALGEKLVPFSKQIDFEVKRDLDHAYCGMYSFSGADVLCVLTGTFHPDKLEAAAGKGISTPFGVVVTSTYAGRTLHTVANVGFTMLSEHTTLAGSEAAMRRALDRIQAGTVKRELAPWMGDWVTQKDFPVLLASDVTRQSVGKTVSSYLPWIEGVQYVRARGRFNPDGSVGISGALTYPDAAKAQTAATGLGNVSKSFMLMTYLKLLGLDPLVRSLQVTPADKDVQFMTVLSERDSRNLLKLLTSWVGEGIPQPPPPDAKPAPSTTPPGTKI